MPFYLSAIPATAGLGALLAGPYLAADLRFCLYTNAVDPAVGLDTGNFIEAIFDGYVRKTIAAWGTILIDPAGNAYSAAPPLKWDATMVGPAQLVYGMFLQDASGNYRGFFPRADGPLLMGPGGAASDGLEFTLAYGNPPITL